MKISQTGLDLIKRFEGCRLEAYKAVKTEKYCTIGYGHYGADVAKNAKITQAQANAYLVADMAKFESYVNNKSYVPISLNQNQFDALVSFCYNCGQGCLKSLCAGRTAEQIAAKILAYNKSGGSVLNGLTTRRKAEQELFKTVVATVAVTAKGIDYSLVFDSKYYADKYADLKAVFEYDKAKLLNHFVNFGMKEHRQAIASFNPVAYRNRYVDLQKAFGVDWTAYYLHYIQHGNFEGRKAV